MQSEDPDAADYNDRSTFNFQNSFLQKDTTYDKSMAFGDSINLSRFFQPYINDKYKVRVADITFAYNNQELIDLLKKRGNYIKMSLYDYAK